MAIFPGTSITPVAGGVYTYPINQSLRFEDGSSAYLSRTPASSGSLTTWTWSGWVKRGNLGSNQYIFNAYTSSYTLLRFDSTDRLEFLNNATTLETAAQFRDPSAWYHIVLTWDSSNATADDRVRLYVNGERISDWQVTPRTVGSSESSYWNSSSQAHMIGTGLTAGSNLFDGYMAEVHFIDGSALGPEYFGETDDTWGIWKPKAYSGSYGTNGFYLDFSNGAAIGEDSSGNSNDWTANNLAATDIMLDSPTNNWCTLSSVDFANNSGYLSEGNLKISDTSSSNLTAAGGTFGFTSGKWYFEANLHIQENDWYVGVVKNDQTIPGGTWNYTHTGFFAISGLGTAYVTDGAGSQNSAGTTVAQGDIIQVAYDADTGRIYFGKNGTWLNSADPAAGTGYLETTDNPEEGYRPIASVIGDASGYSDIYMNFGQDSSFSGIETAQNNTDANGYGDFYYSPPSGFLALCSANLEEAAVIPSENFDVVLDAGADIKTTAEALFTDQLEWIKDRANANNHQIIDSVRGTSAVIQSNTTAAETTYSTPSGNSVAWVWKSNGTGSSNTDGSITSTVAANPDAGFSIVSYTGTGSNETVGHGLSQAPEMIINKRTSGSYHWLIWHTAFNDPDKALLFNTDAVADNRFGPNYPTSTVFGAYAGQGSISGVPCINYCFHSVDGYSKFGSYTGNGSLDGPFVYTGFRPAFVLAKRTDSTGAWFIYDSERSQYNEVNVLLIPNTSGAELDYPTDVNIRFDILSNGFKFRNTASAQNASGSNYIFAAFAESPFNYSTAR